MSLYNINRYSVETILSWIRSGEVVIPELQRPFVWKATKVRDLIDSLYRGFPVGFLIVWNNPDIRLKDGTISQGKKILIDGQQRVTALRAALAGLEVIDEKFQPKRISISFNVETETFDVLNAAIKKDPRWIPDISEIFKPGFKLYSFINDYREINQADADLVEHRISALRSILNQDFGCIDLLSTLGIEPITEIFIRINSKGAVLSQSDFVMSKIASDTKYGGPKLRRTIDYFCHLLQKPEDLGVLKSNTGNKQFWESEEGRAIEWAASSSQNLYQPDYKQILRVSYLCKFGRGLTQDLVSLLSGRDFETRTFQESIAEQSFSDLREGVLKAVNKNYFENFLMILESAGFLDSSMISSSVATDVAYALYLIMKGRKYSNGEITSTVRKWFVFSLLTQRYSGSSESVIDRDIKEVMKSASIPNCLEEMAKQVILEGFWETAFPEKLGQGSTRGSTAYNIYLAAQVRRHTKVFLSKEYEYSSLLDYHGDVHHLFPQKYLIKNGFNREKYNQVANYVMTQTETNIRIKDKAPFEYMQIVLDQCVTGKLELGDITSKEELLKNLKDNDIPEGFCRMTAANYDDFLKQRRLLMSKRCKEYYESL